MVAVITRMDSRALLEVFGYMVEGLDDRANCLNMTQIIYESK